MHAWLTAEKYVCDQQVYGQVAQLLKVVYHSCLEIANKVSFGI